MDSAMKTSTPRFHLKKTAAAKKSVAKTENGTIRYSRGLVILIQMDTNWKPAQNPRRWPAFITSFLTVVTCKLFCPLLHEGTTSDDDPDSGPAGPCVNFKTVNLRGNSENYSGSKWAARV